MQKKVGVYVDGYNMYHALCALKDEKLKWLDLRSLAEKLTQQRSENIVYIKYFSAYMKKKEDLYRRHQTYVTALEARSVEFIEGHFKAVTLRCKKCGESFKKYEEKQTDVNIGAHLVADALRDRFDKALVLSGDTDLAGAIAHTHKELSLLGESSKEIVLAIPPNQTNKKRSKNMIFITKDQIMNSALPDTIQSVHGKTIQRPRKYLSVL